MNHIKCIILFMLKLCNLNRWKCVRQLNNIKCKFRPNHFFFSVEDVVPTKTIRIYPNQKPWINSDVRSALSARTSAFKSGNTDDRKQASYDLKLKNTSTTTTQEACGRASTTSQALKGINQLL